MLGRCLNQKPGRLRDTGAPAVFILKIARGLASHLNRAVVTGHLEVTHSTDPPATRRPVDLNGSFPVVGRKHGVSSEFLRWQRRSDFQVHPEFRNCYPPLDWIIRACRRALPMCLQWLQTKIGFTQVYGAAVAI